MRENPYIVDRSTPRNVAGAEALWEEALFWQWMRPAQGSAPWTRLLTYQVNLPNQKQADGWGEIDLLGVSNSGLPLVVELKAENSSEGPARMLVQAAAYGVALRKAWPAGLRMEWESAVGAIPEGPSLPTDLTVCELVCAAPAEYWVEWTGDSPRGRTISAESWAALARLRKALAGEGFPSVFLSLGHQGKDAGLPQKITVQEESLPKGRLS